MKWFILFLLTSFPLLTFADCNREAQFIGTVTNFMNYPKQENELSHYSYKIKLGHKGNYWFQPSLSCALWEDELEKATISGIGFPNLAEGDAISGILIFDQDLQIYRVE